MKIWSLELWRAWRDGTFRLGLSLFLFCSILALAYGSHQVQRQSKVLEKLPQLLRESNEVYFEARFKDDEDIGRAHYYLKQATAHQARPEAALSLGQRDLHSYHQSVGLRSLYTNLFDAGFENPSRSESGHFDLAFVLVYLLPLVVIASTHDLLAREVEGKTVSLLRASGYSLKKLFCLKMATRFFLSSALLALIVFGSLVWVGASLASFGPWLIVALGYNLFWFGISAVVVGFAWNSARSAGLLLAFWTFLTIICPALLNLLLPREATQSGAALTIECRQVVNNGWDEDKKHTKEAAEKRVSTYSSAPVEGEKFTWSWYYAMHDSADFSVEDKAAAYFRGLAEKDQKSFAYSLLSLPVRTQLLLDRLAGTDLRAHLDYYHHVIRTRELMQEAYLPRVFQGERLNKEQLLHLHDALDMVDFQPGAPKDFTRGALELWIVALLFVGLGWLKLGKLEQRLAGAS